MNNRLTILGSINVDHVLQTPYFLKPGETLKAHDYKTVYGGKGANQAVAAARLKSSPLEVHFLGCVGDDSFGRPIKSALRNEGINVDHLEILQNTATGMAFIQVSKTGENSIVISGGANDCVDNTYLMKHRAPIQDTHCLLMQLETPLPTILEAAKLAKQRKSLVVLNPAPAYKLPIELYDYIDIITPNETEAQILTGITVTDTQSAQQAADILHHYGVKCVLITLGKNGVYFSRAGEQGLITGFNVDAVDTTAAGDTFNAGFIIALLEGELIPDAIRFGQAAAAISVTRAGAQPSIPTRSEVLAFLKDKI